MQEKPKRKKTTRREQWDLLKDSPDYWQLAFELVTQGQHLREIANSSGAKFSTWYSYVTNHPDILAGYQAALAARAEVARERIELLTEEILAGDIEPKAARVALEALKWRAEAGGGRGSQFRQDKGTSVQVAVQNNTTSPFSASYLEALRMHNQSALIDTQRNTKSIPLDNKRDPALITLKDTQRDQEGVGKGSGRDKEGTGKGSGRDQEGMKKGSGRDTEGIELGIELGMDQGIGLGIEEKGTNQRTATDPRAHETATALRGFTLSSSRRPRSKRA